MTPYRLTRRALLADLIAAYLSARRHKRSRAYQQRFERRAGENLNSLCDELWTRTYRPRPSVCFIISDPKRREVFAADFRDRIVHHLYYNYTHLLFERTFVADSYSCIKGRGTHYGISRLEHHIRAASQNYTRPCYVLKLDIRGYFMHIDRGRLLDIALDTIRRMARHRIDARRSERWDERVDIDFVCYLTRLIVMLNPVSDCRRVGSAAEWEGLPRSKSLFHSPEGCGLPIGNLTSQLFSNVYLNRFDQYMKRTLGVRHYGRYVDDAYAVSTDRRQLHALIPAAARFLHDELGLELHAGKVRIDSARQGVEFLGAYVKPHRSYISSATLRRMQRKLPRLEDETDPVHLRSTLNSYLGVLSHYRTCRLRRRLFYPLNNPWRYGRYVHCARGLKYVLADGDAD